MHRTVCLDRALDHRARDAIGQVKLFLAEVDLRVSHDELSKILFRHGVELEASRTDSDGAQGTRQLLVPNGEFP